jgi:hypothetical protein
MEKSNISTHSQFKEGDFLRDDRGTDKLCFIKTCLSVGEGEVQQIDYHDPDFDSNLEVLEVDSSGGRRYLHINSKLND